MEHRTPRLAWLLSKEALLFFGSLLLFAVWGRGFIDGVDPQIRYMVAQRIWHDGSIFLSAEDGARLTASGGENGFFLPRRENGEYISFYGLGQSVMLVPSVAAGDLLAHAAPPERRAEIRYLAPQLIYMTFCLPLVTALLLLAVALLAQRIGIPRTQAIWTAFALGFGTYLLFYAKTLCHNIEIATWFAWGLVVVTGGAPTTRRALFAGLLLGVPLLYRQEALIPVGLAAGVILYRQWRAGSLRVGTSIALLAPIACLGLCVLAHNYARSGSVLHAWPGGKLPEWHRPLFADGPLENLLPMLFGAAKGLVWYCPIFFASGLLLWKRARRWSSAMTLAALPALGFTAFWASTDWVVTEGGWGPRYLVPLAPFYLLGLSWALTPLFTRPRWARALAGFTLACVAFEVAVSFESHNSPVSQTIAVNAALASAEPAEVAVAPALTGFRGSMLAGRLRNLGVPLGDSPQVLAEWNSPRVQGLRYDLADEVWWLKLGKKFGSAELSHLLTVLACLTLLAGVLLIGASLRPARRETVRQPFDTPETVSAFEPAEVSIELEEAAR